MQQQQQGSSLMRMDEDGILNVGGDDFTPLEASALHDDSTVLSMTSRMETTTPAAPKSKNQHVLSPDTAIITDLDDSTAPSLDASSSSESKVISYRVALFNKSGIAPIATTDQGIVSVVEQEPCDGSNEQPPSEPSSPTEPNEKPPVEQDVTFDTVYTMDQQALDGEPRSDPVASTVSNYEQPRPEPTEPNEEPLVEQDATLDASTDNATRDQQARNHQPPSDPVASTTGGNSEQPGSKPCFPTESKKEPSVEPGATFDTDNTRDPPSSDDEVPSTPFVAAPLGDAEADEDEVKDDQGQKPYCTRRRLYLVAGLLVVLLIVIVAVVTTNNNDDTMTTGTSTPPTTTVESTTDDDNPEDFDVTDRTFRNETVETMDNSTFFNETGAAHYDDPAETDVGGV